MVLYRHGSDIDLIWEHGKTTLKDVSGIRKCAGGTLTQGFQNSVHRPAAFADRPPKMQLYFKLAGADELEALKGDLGDIPYAVKDVGKRRVWLDVEGPFNISRAIKALFNDSDHETSFLSPDMHDALDHEFESQYMNQRHYTPSA